jgi:hypothetical protein
MGCPKKIIGNEKAVQGSPVYSLMGLVDCRSECSYLLGDHANIFASGNTDDKIAY